MTAKKYLGQHWLTSRGALDAMIKAGEVKPSDVVLEIGPGRGVLTAALLATAKKVVAVEKDQELTPLLEEKFVGAIKNKKLILLNEDILKFDPSKLRSYKLVANIPYYLTGAILEKFLTAARQPKLMVLLLQKEVARRIVDGKGSVLSLSVKAYGEPRYVQTVKAGSFDPPPKVDSAILAIKNISRRKFKNIDEKDFFRLLKKGFAHKRKKLATNLGLTAAELSRLGLSANVRAEELSLGDWQQLATIRR